jgi:hypothetical protein
MTQQLINIGVAPADGSGDPIRVSFDKINQNFTEVYSAVTTLQGGPTTAGFVTSVAGKTGQVQLSVSDIIGGVSQGYVDNRVNLEVSQQIASVVGTAPVVLDTLKEIADAIANNPDFATEVFAQLAAKLPKTGGTMTGYLALAADPTNPMEAATKQYVDSKLNMVHPPATAIGQAGDIEGQLVVDSTYLYVCTASYDGVTAIWTRTPLNSTW